MKIGQFALTNAVQVVPARAGFESSDRISRWSYRQFAPDDCSLARCALDGELTPVCSEAVPHIDKAVAWGHCSYRYPIELARRAGARRTLLFHHDPGHDDETLDVIAGFVAGEQDVSLAVEGTVVDL